MQSESNNKADLAKVMLIGQMNKNDKQFRVLKKGEIEDLDLSKVLAYVKKNIDEIEARDLAVILTGVMFVFQ